MKTRIVHSFIFAAFAAVTPIFAQQSPQQQQTGAVLRGSKVIGAKLYNARGEQVGTIDDLLMDAKKGQVSFAVIGTGGVLGVGEKKIVVPFNLIQHDETNPENFGIKADTQRLQQAPSFKGEDQWANVTQPEYLKNVTSHFAGAQQEQQQEAQKQAQQQQQAQSQQQAQAAQQAQQQAQAAQKKVQEAQRTLDQAKQEEQKAQQQAQQANQSKQSQNPSVSTPPQQ